jgi:hypothetical protein
MGSRRGWTGFVELLLLLELAEGVLVAALPDIVHLLEGRDGLAPLADGVAGNAEGGLEEEDVGGGLGGALV